MKAHSISALLAQFLLNKKNRCLRYFGKGAPAPLNVQVVGLFNDATATKIQHHALATMVALPFDSIIVGNDHPRPYQFFGIATGKPVFMLNYDGTFTPSDKDTGNRVVLFQSCLSTGEIVAKNLQLLKKHGIYIVRTCAIFDYELSICEENLKGVDKTSLVTLSDLLELAEITELIPKEQIAVVRKWQSEQKFMLVKDGMD